MAVNDIDTDHYTHVHFAFGSITYDHQIDMSAVLGQFEQFVQLKGVKPIVAFGGWAFSTQPSTYNILRTAVTESNRNQFAHTVAEFVIDNDLDGVDFDWEYPGEPDIPGIPPGGRYDGANYLAFLKLLREVLPSDRSISIAAQASYWYLRPFPIAEISQVVDYIVFMTYDLHGQWDYGNPYSDPGGDGGNCLRSQVNLTKTMEALAMVSKAGVANKNLLLGMALYGRSFEMTEAGCYGQDCTYTGPASGATPGKCTGTSGYLSNWEIYQIIAQGNVQQYSQIDGDILVYDETQWVSWLNPSSYNFSASLAKSWAPGGTSDWAMDLNQTDPAATTPPPPTPTFIDCAARHQDPDQGIYSGYCVCSGSTFPVSLNTKVTPYNSCGYTTMPTSTIQASVASTVITNTANCQICTQIGYHDECTSMPHCVPEITTKQTPTPNPTSSATCQVFAWEDMKQYFSGGENQYGSTGTKGSGWNVRYKNWPSLGGKKGNSIANVWQTLDSKDTGLPNDLMWKALWIVNFQWCKIRCEGVECNGTPGGHIEQMGDFQACVVDFKCEPNLTPLGGNHEGPT